MEKFCDKIVGYQKQTRMDLMFQATKELEWRRNKRSKTYRIERKWDSPRESLENFQHVKKVHRETLQDETAGQY